MAQIDKIKIGDTTYDIAVATSATLAFTSADATSSPAYTAPALLSSGETYASMFNKISQVFQNVRYCYTSLNSKAASSHTHAASAITSGTIAAARLPLSNTHTNSTSYAPTSALVYTLNQGIETLKSKLGM